MRKDLGIDGLGDLVELPLCATLATYRRDGSVLLSPVWHEWRDGGFNVPVESNDVKARPCGATRARRSPCTRAILPPGVSSCAPSPGS